MLPIRTGTWGNYVSNAQASVDGDTVIITYTRSDVHEPGITLYTVILFALSRGKQLNIDQRLQQRELLSVLQTNESLAVFPIGSWARNRGTAVTATVVVPGQKAVTPDPPILFIERPRITHIEQPEGLKTEGGETIYLFGTNLGTSNYESVEVWMQSMSLGKTFSLSCIYHEHSVAREEHLACQSPEGVGSGYTWQVRIQNWLSDKTAPWTSYLPPTVLSFEGEVRNICVQTTVTLP